MRVLPISRIPPDLWRKPLLRLPVNLSTTYTAILDRLGLRPRSVETRDEPVHGGATAEETRTHFARRFAVSAGRTEFTVLGPTDSFLSLSDAFLSTFSDGTVGVLDIPSGSGAMTAALVSTLTHLRAAGSIPRLPLSIKISAGDYAPEALKIFQFTIAELYCPAAAQGIHISWETVAWDATRGDSTAQLIDRWFKLAADATEFFVVVSNFSAALNNAGTFDSFSPCFEQILARLHDKKSTVLWIEPATKGAKSGILKRLPSFIESRIKWLRERFENASEAPAEAEYALEHPVSTAKIQTNVVVRRFERR